MGGYHYLSIHGKDIQLLIPQASSSTVRRNVVCFTQVPFCGGYTSVVMAKVVSGCWIPTLWSCFPFFATPVRQRQVQKQNRRLSRCVWVEPYGRNLVYYQARSAIDTKHVTDILRFHEHTSFLFPWPSHILFCTVSLAGGQPAKSQSAAGVILVSHVTKLHPETRPVPVSVCVSCWTGLWACFPVCTDFENTSAHIWVSHASHCSVHYVLVSVNLN